jgi:hypothetical protein
MFVCSLVVMHGGCFTDSKNPEMVSGRETSGLKIKTTTAPNKMENQMMMLQLKESLSAIF